MSNDNTNDNDNVKLHFDEGIDSADHRNMDAAGDGHPLGQNPKDWEVSNMRVLIKQIADDLYSSWEATIREYLANAETACRRVEKALDDDMESVFDAENLYVSEEYEPLVEVEWNKQENRVTIKDNGIGMAGIETDRIFSKIATSAAAMEGTHAGQWGMGALSFLQLEGEDDSMLMVTHSRQNDDNYAANISLAGPEPVMGRLGDEEYGTKFEMTPKNPDWNIRQAVDTYAEYLRVPVRYTEIDQNGAEEFNEDYGGKTIHDDFGEDEIIADIQMDGAFTAVASPNASGKTLSLTMPIERNGNVELSTLDTSVDVQLHDESGKVIVSDNGHEGKVPVSRSEYNARLMEQVEDIIPENALDRTDVIGQAVEAGPNEGMTALTNDTFDKRFPDGNTDQYVPKRDLTGDDVPGATTVIEGEHVGRTVVDRDEWEEGTNGMLPNLVPEDELESYDVDTGSGDLCLPRPKSDRDSLQDNEVFWTYVSEELDSQVSEIVEAIKTFVEESDDPTERLRELDERKVRELAP
jgi:hypothetical protein